MKQRCHNPKHPRYDSYGGRGILVCEEWRNSFITFYNDMGERPSNKHSLDRIDNDKGYSPDNCRWITRKEQNENMRERKDFIKVIVHDKEYSLRELSEEYGVKYNRLRYRFYKGIRGEDLIKPTRSNSTDTH